MHDTYYVVAHFEWVLMLTLASICLFALLSIVRRRSAHMRAKWLAILSTRIWVVGLTITLGATFAMRLLTAETILANLWVIQMINATITVGGFLMILAIGMTAATVMVALWSMIMPRSE